LSPLEEIFAAVADFRSVASLAGEPLGEADLVFEFHEAPHLPPSKLPVAKMAIYGFWAEGRWLKIGKVGANSQARYTSQHYNSNSARSTLAESLLVCPDFGPQFGGQVAAVKDWIKARCHRVNILVPSTHSYELLSLFEAFLHARLWPRYER
jgi:hypothetical protein